MGKGLKSGFLNVSAPRETLLINPTAFRSCRPSCTPRANRRRGSAGSRAVSWDPQTYLP